MQARWISVTALLASMSLSALLVLAGARPLVAQVPPDPRFGDGRDGDLVVGAGQTVVINTVRVAVSASGTAATPGNSIGFSAGDAVLLHRSQNTANAGRWELNQIVAINSPTSWTLATPLAYSYDAVNGGAQAIKVPQYRSVTVGDGGTLTAPAWDSSRTGGIVAFKAAGTVAIGTNATVSARGIGYRGGAGGHRLNPTNGNDPARHGYQGEGRTGPGGQAQAPNAAGGGGGRADVTSNDGGGGGGGGSHATAGRDGTIDPLHPFQDYGRGATVIHGTADLTVADFGGGGAGGGSDDGLDTFGGAGGAGGGVVLLFGAMITGNGTIDASGSPGGNGTGSGQGAGGGGGGAGGSVKVVAQTLSLGAIRALGGAAGSTNSQGGNGGSGGLGRVSIDYCDALSAPSDPPATTQLTCAGPPAASPAALFGDGADGDFAGGDPNTVRTALAGTAGAGQALIPVATTAGFGVGQEVLIIQMQGTGAGGYEFGVIAGLGPGALTLQQDLSRTYVQDGAARAQVLRVPHFATVSGTIATAEWDGSTGGIVVFRALDVSNASVEASARGFKGGYGNDSAIHAGGICQVSSGQGQAQQGTSYPGVGGCSKAANGGGGGGGGNPAFVPNAEFGSGGGGGYGSPGGGGAGGAAGAGGAIHGDAELAAMFLGSGGGGGTWGTNPYGGGRRSIQGNDQSGQGGGVAFVAARTIAGLQVYANGNAGGNSNGGFGGYAGGGGSGGTIRIIGNTVSLGSVQALGGPGGDGTIADGGVGGVGRIRIEYCDSLTGSTVPPASVQQLACNTPPTVMPPDDQLAIEGGATSFALGSFTDPDSDGPWSVDVDWGDGSNHATFNAAAAGALGSQVHSYADNDSYTVTLTVTDQRGGFGAKSFQVSVANAMPVLTVVGAPSTDEGAAYAVSLGASDPGTDTILGWRIDWGDGTIEMLASNPASATHTYADGPNSYTISATATDEEGSYSANPISVTVQNAAPDVDLSGPTSANEGTVGTYTFTVADLGTDTFTVATSFPDCGPTSQLVEGSLTITPGGGGFQCRFHDGPASTAVRIQVADDDGAPSEVTSHMVAIANEPPAVNPLIVAPASSNEGGAVTASATFADPSTNDSPFTCTVDYGDGTGPLPGSVSGSTCTGPAHTYDDDGTYTIAAVVADKDGGSGANSAAYLVRNVAPAPSIDGLFTGNTSPEGTALALTASATDASSADTAAGFAFAWSVTKDGAPYGPGGTGASFTFTPDDDGSYVVTLTATDKDGGVGTTSATIAATNVAPVATFTVSPDALDEGSAFTLLLANPADPSSADMATGFAYAFDCGDGAGYGPFGPRNTATCTATDNPGYIAKGKIRDKDGGVTEYEAPVEIANVAPAIGAVVAPLDPTRLGIAVAASAPFADPGPRDTHTAIWGWGDGTTSPGVVTETKGSGTVAGSHTYVAPGVYTITVAVTDKDGGADVATFQYIVIYNPDGGFVTGAGWIDSPVDACRLTALCAGATGKAHFGFSAKYQNGASIPTGNTAFRFRAGNLEFQSDSYQWLVVAGARAQYKGSGAINGQGEYGFLLTAVDGQASGGGGADRFRIKIWDKATGAVVYDNQLGAADDAEPATAIGGGSIVIHRQ